MKWLEVGWSEDMKEAARRERRAIWWEKLPDEEKRKYMERKARKRAQEERKRLEKNAKEDLKRLERNAKKEIKDKKGKISKGNNFIPTALAGGVKMRTSANS